MEHIQNLQQKTQIEQTISMLCIETNLTCLNIDQHLSLTKNKDAFLADGHWNQTGHQRNWINNG